MQEPALADLLKLVPVAAPVAAPGAVLGVVLGVILAMIQFAATAHHVPVPVATAGPHTVGMSTQLTSFASAQTTQEHARAILLEVAAAQVADLEVDLEAVRAVGATVVPQRLALTASSHRQPIAASTFLSQLAT